MKEIIHPGEFIKDEVLAMGQTLEEFSKKTYKGYDDIIAGKSGIRKEIAILLEDYFDISRHYWMNIQMGYENDVEEAERQGPEGLQKGDYVVVENKKEQFIIINNLLNRGVGNWANYHKSQYPLIIYYAKDVSKEYFLELPYRDDMKANKVEYSKLFPAHKEGKVEFKSLMDALREENRKLLERIEELES